MSSDHSVIFVVLAFQKFIRGTNCMKMYNFCELDQAEVIDQFKGGSIQ